MQNRLLATDDRSSGEMIPSPCRSQSTGHKARGTCLLRRQIVNLTAFFAFFALLIPLVSCELDNGYMELKADELKKLIDDGPAILVVDNRSEYEYGRGHIPMAINIPQERFSLLNTLLPKDKGFPIVFYCTGYG